MLDFYFCYPIGKYSHVFRTRIDAYFLFECVNFSLLWIRMIFCVVFIQISNLIASVLRSLIRDQINSCPFAKHFSVVCVTSKVSPLPLLPFLCSSLKIPFALQNPSLFESVPNHTTLQLIYNPSKTPIDVTS